MMNYLDCHSHTHHSPDADRDATPEKMFEAAKKAGFLYYGISDHCDLDGDDEKLREVLLRKERSIEHLYRFSRKISEHEKTQFLVGLELGQALDRVDIANEIVSDSRLDFVIGSLHNLRGGDDFYRVDYSGGVDDSINMLRVYYKEMLELAEWGGYDILGHITYPLRHMVGEAGFSIDMNIFTDDISRILDVLVRKDKALEVNTSGYRQSYGRSYPDADIVRLFKDLGGKYISLGSDAHAPQNVGNGILRGIEMIREAGFSQLCAFVNRKPCLIDI